MKRSIESMFHSHMSALRVVGSFMNLKYSLIKSDEDYI